MNNIYKVIWSKAKNCYVVASEIARSHTKSATGSGKIGGVTRRSLLASLMALSLLCGGLGVAEAAVVHVNEVAGGTSAVYTTDETYTKTEADAKLDLKANAGDVNTELAKKADKATTLAGYGITDAYTKADVDNAVAGAVATAGTNVDAKLADYAKTADVDTKLAGKADKATTLAGYGITDAYTKGEVAAKLNTKANQTDLTQATDRITANETTIAGLTTKTTKITYDAALGTNVDGVTFNAGAVTGVTSINGTEIGTKESGTYIHQDSSIWGNMKKVDTQVKTNADNIETNKNDITALNNKVGTVGTGDYLDPTKSVGDNLGLLDAGLKKEVGDRTAAVEAEKTAREAEDTNLSNRIGTVTEDGAYIKKSTTNNVSENLKVLDTRAKTNADAIAQETADRKAAIGELAVNGNYIEKDKSVSDNLVKLDNQAKANADEIVKTNERTGGIARNTEKTQTTIEGSVKVDNQGNVKDVKGLSAETITTTGNATIGGDLKVAGTITTDKMVFGDPATNNYTEIDHGKVTSKNLVVNGAGQTISSSSTFDVEKNEVGFTNTATGDHSYYKQTAKGINGYVTDKDGNKTYTKVTATENSFQVQDKDGKNKNHQVNTKDSSVTEITNGDGKTTKTEQTAENITNTAKDGTIKNDAKDIVNNASGNISNKSQTMDTTVTGKATESYGELDTTVTGQATENFNGGLNTKVTGAENHTVTGKQTNTVEGGQENIISGGQINKITGDQTTTVTGKVTENYKAGQATNVTGNQDIHVTGKQTNKIDGDQENTIGGNQTTTVTGDISNKAENITNEASNSITDKVGDHTRVLDSDGITDTVGGSTFKQRIDKIMMESKNVSIKAEETLTNEAKVITNKASEVINNEAVNINNTATGIITSKASEIKNQADKLISNKVGENTWENMENGKITTSIKDGAKQNLTQSDAAGTTQSTVDGGKSTVTIQNADGLADAVTDGTNTSVQNQTASAIAAAVKDGAGNENASVANATTSVNTIKSGSKANTVISTADGTSFINSEAAAPVGDGTEVKTTIKGNTITTGKVTMDYAEVMKDIGVRGNANIAGKTTTGSLEVKGESKLTGDVTMESNATVKKDLTVEGNTNLKNTKVDGTLDVTQKATFGDSVSIAKDLSVDGNATIKGDVTAKSYKVGDKTYISAAGINANDQKITNVADGSISEGSKDAVNGGQLYTVKNDLEGKVNKVGANAAAMANLHPMEFDPSSKWNIAAAIGNYGSETAAALGAFYRPNDDVMVNLSTAFGTGENMVGGGVSVRLGKGGNKLSREETNALKAQVADLTARMDALLSVLNPNMSKDFPDVPENHWAYEAVSRLAGNDIVQGYPDGEFHGERTMTRYEMAEIIYNALSRGAEAEKELVEEFKPELQAMAASEKATAEKAEG